jgi:acyl-coenzyme A synthetase/AMP-(fatty) acid ligase
MQSLIYTGIFDEKDTIIQMARCSFDIHVEDIMGTLMAGATLIMLHPKGNIDFDYLSSVLKHKQISYMHTVPSLLHNFFMFLKATDNRDVVKCLRTLCSSGEWQTNKSVLLYTLLLFFIGEPCSTKLVNLITSQVAKECRVWNLYGPAEATIDCTLCLVDRSDSLDDIPMGKPILNYFYMIKDEFSQNVIIGQEGELYVGGVGVFAGYLGRDDLTEKALVEIDGEIFYRTGDLVRIDNNGVLHYQGRKDHQIKLHGQRIELGEIERCLLNTSISACVVVKLGDDHLVAYIQTSNINEEQLREHCQSHLPPHMIPSIFMVLEKLPLNVNGKIDRKQLPEPTFGSLSMSTNKDLYMEPKNALEMQIHSVWSDILQRTHISTNTNFFNIGGHSLLLVQLYHRYKTIFEFDTHSINMAEMIEYSTIADHARLIRHSTNAVKCGTVSWFLLRFYSSKSF